MASDKKIAKVQSESKHTQTVTRNMTNTTVLANITAFYSHCQQYEACAKLFCKKIEIVQFISCYCFLHSFSRLYVVLT